MKSFLPSEENVRPIGRTCYMNEKLYCAFSGTGAEFIAKGTECKINIQADSTVKYNTNLARIAIYLDGERVVDSIMDEPEKSFVVFSSDTARECEIKVIKLSEAPMSSIAVKSIDVEGGGIRPSEENKFFIEFIGDSITCGYGVDDEDLSHIFSTATEDCTKAYAYKTAQALGADLSIVAFSGHGVISGFSDGERKVSEQTVPPYYKTLGYVYCENDDFDPKKISWDFSRRRPDLVVLNLGTNDDSYCVKKEDRCGEFCTEYEKFLGTIRECNPDSYILCVLGIMGQDMYPYIERAVKAHAEKTGDKKISSMMFDVQLEEDGKAVDSHPTERTHKKAAEKLTAEIRKIFGI